MDRVKIFGINIENTTLDDVMILLEEKLDSYGLFTIATPNTEIAMRAKDQPKFADLVNGFDLVVPDGIGLIYASKIRKLPLKERVTGFDISMELLSIGMDKPFNLYLLGGKQGISEKAANNVEKEFPGVTVVGNRNGYFTLEDEEEIVSSINQTNPDVIFIGLGFPKQEEFIERNKGLLKGKIIIGNGGVIDILAGESKRAPDIFINLNLEWLYRLIKEPSRIARQMALPRFIINVITNKNSVLEGDIENERHIGN